MDRGDKVWFQDGKFRKLGLVVHIDGLLARVNPYSGDRLLTIPIRHLVIADDRVFQLRRFRWYWDSERFG